MNHKQTNSFFEHFVGPQHALVSCCIVKRQYNRNSNLWLWNTTECARCLCVSVSVCVCVCVFPPPHLKWSSVLRDVIVPCEASQLNGLWSVEVSSVDLRITWRQWRPGFYRKNKTEAPGLMAPVVGGAWLWYFTQKKRPRSGLYQTGCFISWLQYSSCLNITGITIWSCTFCEVCSVL